MPFFLFLFLAGFGSLSAAAPSTFQEFRKNGKVAKEVEVMPENLVHLLPYFDLSKLVMPPNSTAPREYVWNYPAPGVGSTEERKKWDIEIALALKDASTPNQAVTHGNLKTSLRRDCPSDVKAILNQMNWSFDGDALEFRDSTPYSDPMKYSEHTQKFLKLVKLENVQNDPMKYLGKTHFHIHLSLEGRNQEPMVQLLNNYILLRFIEGKKGKLALTDWFGFTHDIYERGLVRMYDPNHFEIRNHTRPFEEEVSAAIRLMTQPEEDSLRELSQEIQKRLTPARQKLIAYYQPESLIPMLDQINPHLPLESRISKESPFVIEAIKRGVFRKTPKADALNLLMGQLDELRKVPEADLLFNELAKEIRERAGASPERFFEYSNKWKDSQNYEELLRWAVQPLPEGEAEAFLADPKWAIPFRRLLEKGWGLPLPAFGMAQENPGVERCLVDALSHYGTYPAGAALARLDPNTLSIPSVRTAALGAIDSVGWHSYEEMLRNISEFPDSALKSELLPLLQAGIRRGNLEAIRLDARIRGVKPGVIHWCLDGVLGLLR